MRCPNCGHLMLKGKLAESCWECPTCKGRWFVVQTTPPSVKVTDEEAKEKWHKIIVAQYDELRRLGVEVPPGFIDFSLAYAFLKEDGVIQNENDQGKG